MDSEERRNLFTSRVPEAFPSRLVASLEVVYREASEETRDLPIPYQRYYLPHLRRLRSELAFMSAAGAAGLTTRVVENASRDGHALAILEPFVMSLSKTDGASLPPRLAEFRAMYSGLASIAQFPLGLEGYSEPDPVEYLPDNNAIYGIVTHGPSREDGKRGELGFVYVHFPSPGGRRFQGQGIDLLSRYGRGPTEGDQSPAPPRPPDIQPRSG